MGVAQQALLGVSAGGSSSSLLITAQTVGTARNNFSGKVGFQFTVGGSPITVSDLGRWVISGNSSTHTVGIYNSSYSALGTVTVNTSGAPAGAYLYTTLGSPIVLSASTSYYLLSDETNSGDQWYDDDTAITMGSAAAAVNSAGSDNAAPTPFFTHTSGNFSYGPVNLKYT